MSTSTDKKPFSTYKMTSYKMTEQLEKEINRLKEELKEPVNRLELDKWIKEGELHEEHEEVQLFLKNRMNVLLSQEQIVRTGRNNINDGRKRITGRTFYSRPAKNNAKVGMKRHYKIPPREPRPPETITANIVIKPLDPTMFPTFADHTAQMLNDLDTAGLLNTVIGLNINCRIRRYQTTEYRLNPD
ncbi:hypothetical protein GLOIN_2v1484674 [Rhizophagus clarus]|uniref:Uncharacterized protein n=1 Tax=Rhizophagus clarus TaxID=94130 RepID=A0A8H3LXS1_9GLOM|nr:hypothetical protein GLOIN_2v1484674 [Rhizophagus clarus]